MKNAEREGAMNPISCRADRKDMADRVFFFRVDVYNIGNEEKKRERERKKSRCKME